MKPLFWTKEAEDTYLEVVDFLLQTWGQSVLEKFEELLDHRIANLQKAPLIGKSIPGTFYRQLLIHKHVSVFYRDYQKHILLLAVWDVRQNPTKLTEILVKHRS